MSRPYQLAGSVVRINPEGAMVSRPLSAGMHLTPATYDGTLDLFAYELQDLF